MPSNGHELLFIVPQQMYMYSNFSMAPLKVGQTVSVSDLKITIM